LLDDLEDLDYIERVKIQQRNWIGRSTGAEVDFATTAGDSLKIFTTRPDTLFGATYMVVSPEHALLGKWLPLLENAEAVRAYQCEAARKSDFERTEMNKVKTGVELLGVRAINPATGGEIPIFISDYVLASYGTGAIMAVPGHDQRDWEFAKAFHLPIVEVVAGGDITKEAFESKDAGGILVNSGFLNGLRVKDAIGTMIRWLTEHGIGKEQVNFKLRDWVFARQRYWGEPIPLVYCETCGWVALSEEQLPLKLPEVESYETTGDGESPLAAMDEWVNTTCPHCGGPAKRETDTMPQWAGSSWYFLRYMDPKNAEALVGREAVDYWKMVDWYNGGMEHTTLHLLYSRFWHKFLYDIGVVPTKEPYQKRTSQGTILGPDGFRMNKTRGNVVSPIDVADEYGADTMRLYIMFIGDFEKDAPWNPTAVKGCKRFLDRVWNLAETPLHGDAYSAANEAAVHRTIKKVGEDIEAMKFNTAIAALMTLINEFSEHAPSRGDIRALLMLLAPFAPHIAEELWEIQGFEGIASLAPWPDYDESKLAEALKEIAVQVNGKLKTTVTVPTDSADEAVISAARNDEKVLRLMEGMEFVKAIVIKNKLVNLIMRPTLPV
ncbi:MAG: class I tRNA ligase family protein, partial [Firmicutes bacterium]|nr:class I tRNA ligase family protein [Bacillota bacterium]